jgi:hypothetical protein
MKINNNWSEQGRPMSFFWSASDVRTDVIATPHFYTILTSEKGQKYVSITLEWFGQNDQD